MENGTPVKFSHQLFSHKVDAFLLLAILRNILWQFYESLQNCAKNRDSIRSKRKLRYVIFIGPIKP